MIEQKGSAAATDQRGRSLDAPFVEPHNRRVTESDRVPSGEWVEMEVRGLIIDPTSESPVIVLRQVDGSLFLPIWIGTFEANAIALAVEGVETPRPLTHDLLRSLLVELDAKLERVEIHDLREGTFYARLIVSSATADRREIDARPSDAIALALRADAPVWTARAVLDAAVADSRATVESDDERIREWLAKAGPEDLGKYSM